MIRKSLIWLHAFLPAMALAHPGHKHPGEEDEFDQLRADWLHAHGYFEATLAAILVASALAFRFNRNRKARIAAAIAFGSSLVLLAAS